MKPRAIWSLPSLWQWRLHADEPGHEPYFLAPGSGWREALVFEGSAYVGVVPQILAGLPTTDMKPDWTRAIAGRGLSLDGGIMLVYRESGGPVRIADPGVPLGYTVVDPRDGKIVTRGIRADVLDPIPDEGGEPRLNICAPEGLYRGLPAS